MLVLFATALLGGYPKMAPSILTIPLEILININSYLYLEDYINLRNSRIKLFRSLNGESASRAFISVMSTSTILAIEADCYLGASDEVFGRGRICTERNLQLLDGHSTGFLC